VVFLTISLGISLFMNWYNARIALWSAERYLNSGCTEIRFPSADRDRAGRGGVIDGCAPIYSPRFPRP